MADTLLQTLATSKSDGLVSAEALNVLGDLFAYWDTSAPAGLDEVFRWLVNTECTGDAFARRFGGMALKDVPGLSARLMRDAKSHCQRMDRIRDGLSDTQRRFFETAPLDSSLAFLEEMRAWIAAPSEETKVHMAGIPEDAGPSAVLDHMLEYLEKSDIKELSTLILSRATACSGDMDVFMARWADKMNRAFMAQKAEKIAGFCDNLVDGMDGSVDIPPDVDQTSEYNQWMMRKKIDRALQNDADRFSQHWARLAHSLGQWYTRRKPLANRRGLLLARLCAHGLEAQTTLWCYFTEDGCRRMREYPHNFAELGLEAKVAELRRLKKKRRMTNADQREMLRIYMAMALLADVRDLDWILSVSKSGWETDAHLGRETPT